MSFICSLFFTVKIILKKAWVRHKIALETKSSVFYG